MKTWFVIFAILGILSFTIHEISAVPHQYNVDLLNINWTTISNATVLDVDANGYADQIYTYNNAGQVYTFTKILGNGTSPKSVTMPSAPANHLISSITVNKNIIYLSSNYGLATLNCYSNVGRINVLNGTVHNTILSHLRVSPAGTHTAITTSGMTGNSNEPILNTECEINTGINDFFISKNSTGTIATGGTNNNKATWYGNSYFSSSIYGTVDAKYHTAPASFLASSGSTTLGNCNPTSGCVVGTSLTTPSPTLIVPVAGLASTAKIDPNIQIYYSGLALPKTNDLTVKPLYWSSYVPTLDSSEELVLALLHYEILDPSLSSEPARFIFNNGTHRYIAYATGNNIKYASVDTILNNRAIGYYLIDTDPPAILIDAVTGTLNPYSVFLTTFNSTVTNTIGGIVSLVSGYTISPSATTVRTFEPRVNNSTTLVPIMVGATTSQIQLSFLLKNAPIDSAIDIRDAYEYQSDQFSWSQDYTHADRTFDVDLPYPRCVDIYVRDLTELELPWNFIGNICNTGTMPKTIIYTTDLSFTFYSLPYGVAHTFNQPVTELTTIVRHDTLPYNYTIKIYDSNGVLQYNNEFQEASSTIDTQNINTTGISLPAMMKVYDVDDQQIYYSTLGVPSYLSQSVAWFGEWFTISGFNLLFMIPIVFGAMFTRNTVGIGTMSTVALIATLTWFGIIPVPDIAIYLMIFIAVIGVIAYKKMYD